MINIIRQPDRVTYKTSEGFEKGDCKLNLDFYPNMINVTLSSKCTRPEIITLFWKGRTDSHISLMGDAWERGYGELGFHGIQPDRYMPWYFLVKENDIFCGYGVMTMPSCMVSWKYDSEGISLVLDVRCGGEGVFLDGRTLHACTVVSSKYSGLSALEAAHFFCKLMCVMPLMPQKPLYGGNNWYYAYGNSSKSEIIADAELQASLSEGLSNRPYMVIDDGWQINSCAGPWEPNERFEDMKEIADAFKNMDVRPGIWIRPLRDESEDVPSYWRLNKAGLDKSHPDFNKQYLDPSHPEVLSHIGAIVKKLTAEWGYELIKHDFSTFDMFGDWGCRRNMLITDNGWSFYNKNLTSAEIVKNFYKVILDNSNSAIILGCNTIGHLGAGLMHASRTGDDTSGEHWSRTRKMGVNTLAFRLCQQGAFFAADADCVGIIPGKIPFSLNMRWAELLALSGSPFFISCAKASLEGENFDKMKELYKIASLGGKKLEIEDMEYNCYPANYSVSGEKMHFDWYE